ncbi:MAG: MFS transporter [Candidatus Altiarchaeota archaeon]|nr:MFS transporter [Candidatus Altiarchaeota archaeon]
MKQILPILFSVAFLDVLGIGIVIPILPLVFFETNILLGASIATKTLVLGLLISSYSLAQFFGAPILGGLSDKHGRKKILSLSVFGTFIGYLVFAAGLWYTNIILLFLGRIIDGFTGGNLSVVRSIIADISSGEDKVKNFGFIGMAFGVGFILGPFVGGKLANPSFGFDFSTPFIFAAILALVNFFFIQIKLPETLKEKSNIKITLFTGIKNISRAMKMESLRTTFIALFLFIFGWSMFTQFFQVYMYGKFNYTTDQIGNLFGYIGLWIAFTQGILIRPISKKFKPKEAIKIFLPISATMLLFLLIPTKSFYLYMIMPLISMSNGILQPNFSALISNLSDKKSQGEILGIQQSVFSLAQAIPPIIAGYVTSLNIHMPTILASLFIFLGWLYVLKNYQNLGGKKFHEA